MSLLHGPLPPLRPAEADLALGPSVADPSLLPGSAVGRHGGGGRVQTPVRGREVVEEVGGGGGAGAGRDLGHLALGAASNKLVGYPTTKKQVIININRHTKLIKC